MSRIIFLDFDGVLNSPAYLASEDTLTDADYLTQSPALLDPRAVTRLDELVARSGSKVVVSSTWRIRRTTDELQALLRSRGFHGEVVGKTAEGMLDKTRGGEIARWLRENGAGVESFVILDDDPTVSEIEGRYVLVGDGGLSDADCRRALLILVGE